MSRSKPGLRVTPRILVEHPDPVRRAQAAKALAKAGYDVTTCSGPIVFDGSQPHVGCELLRNGPCPFVEDAEVVLCGLDFGPDSLKEIVARYDKSNPNVRVMFTGP